MKFAINANVTFGSGDARASLKIDTKKISPAEATSKEKKGCVQYHYLDLPLEEVRKIKKIEYISEAWPGGRTEFTGSGREFISEMAKSHNRNLAWKNPDPADFCYPQNFSVKQRMLHRLNTVWVKKGSERAKALREKIKS